ncbi:VWA domain-containing protein [Lentiprolixibacter aurantiacus]|uniref:VWA domain-containing protein n=1 Tax=Lentiprolixibacter aurantiacus TaxID=2993939 RepID=A0AAE3MKM2_9FLAO|nr:VWA domain-containing protein [Lentiprolixibacter aurantiacus]MCX2719545.1 VWA domain-containing protein [Lentiprolixibacter aurantiacus]
MQINTVLLLILAALATGLLVYYQYYFRSDRRGMRHNLMAAFRFIALFATLVLLINPEIDQQTIQLEKRKLILVSDHSSSISHSGADTILKQALEQLKQADLARQFDLRQFGFADQLYSGDSTSFTGSITDINFALQEINEIVEPEEAVVVLLTDGNQTYGSDYEYFGSQAKFPVYSLVVGDTTKYEDLRIDQVNLNRYAFLRNRFPIETFISYEGQNPLDTRYSIFLNDERVYSESITLSPDQNTKRITALLEASSIGQKNIRVEVSSFPQERNKANNIRYASLEVLDEQTRVAIVTDMLHPDVGTLKKAIEANEQRAVSILKPFGNPDEWQQYDMFILYQPNNTFQSLYNYLNASGTSRFTITGTKTDWRFLNDVQQSFEKEFVNLNDEVLPVINKGFAAFDTGKIDFRSYPPLAATLGELRIRRRHDVLLEQRIRGVDTGEPMFAIIQENESREAVLFGENIWKWRMQSFRSQQSFEEFDAFVGKIIRLLSTNTTKNRLNLDYENTFRGMEAARIRATYFDRAFQFDGNAKLKIRIRPKGGDYTDRDMLLKQGYYEVNLSDLESGDYEFIVSVEKEELSQSGSFTILEYEVERLFMSSDYEKLERLSERSEGKLFFPDQVASLITEITDNPKYLPTQRSEQNVVSLIDYKILLAAIALALAIEWFLRKYQGLI